MICDVDIIVHNKIDIKQNSVLPLQDDNRDRCSDHHNSMFTTRCDSPNFFNNL